MQRCKVDATLGSRSLRRPIQPTLPEQRPLLSGRFPKAGVWLGLNGPVDLVGGGEASIAYLVEGGPGGR